nr:28S ribosomal protein S14 mitochondrial [Hymenolepis microstoma]
MTSRRRGCKTRWRVSRIIFRSLADYNRLSGAQWAIWMYNTFSTRRHMIWPPPSTSSTVPYVHRYHKNIAD